MSGDVNKPTDDAAYTGESTRSPVLDELYNTLAHAQAGVHLRQQEATAERSDLLSKEQALITQRQQADKAGDQVLYDQMTSELDELRRQLDVIDHDLEDQGELPAQEHQDDVGERDARSSGSSEPGPGDPGPDAAAQGDRDVRGSASGTDDADPGQR